MLKLPDFLRRFMGDRRTHSENVPQERRKKITRSEADKRLREAVDDLDRTVRMRSDDFKCEAVNDIQTQVIFATFSEICTFRVPNLAVRICRHEKHEAANTGIAICNESQCPFARGVA